MVYRVIIRIQWINTSEVVRLVPDSGNRINIIFTINIILKCWIRPQNGFSDLYSQLIVRTDSHLPDLVLAFLLFLHNNMSTQPSLPSLDVQDQWSDLFCINEFL